MSIIVTRIEDEILVSSPYNPKLPKMARAIGGSWNVDKSVWIFNKADEKLAEKLYMDIYNEWENSETIRVRITTHSDIATGNDSVYICGKQVARATGRDSGASVGKDVRWVSGELPTSGGSAKYWCTIVNEGSVFELVNFPVAALEKLANAAEREEFEFTIVEEEKSEQVIDVALLIAEREKLLARIEEINKLLE